MEKQDSVIELMECNVCGKPIERGEEYINLALSKERELDDETIEVIGESISFATFHLGCYPDIIKKGSI